MTLSPRMREIVTLVGRDGTKWPAVAQALGVSRSTVLVHVQRAMERYKLTHRRPREACVELYFRWLADPSSLRPAQQAPPPTGIVYAIATKEEPRRVKIGYTKNLPERLEVLQRASPSQLEVVDSWRGSLRDEAKVHAAAEAHRLHGEWFTMEALLIARSLLGATA